MSADFCKTVPQKTSNNTICQYDSHFFVNFIFKNNLQPIIEENNFRHRCIKINQLLFLFEILKASSGTFLKV